MITETELSPEEIEKSGNYIEKILLQSDIEPQEKKILK
jgi:hypothetical protein